MFTAEELDIIQKAAAIDPAFAKKIASLEAYTGEVGIGQPTAYPKSAPAGPVLITIPVTSNVTYDMVDIAVGCLVYEGSISPLAGPLISYEYKYITLLAGQSIDVQFIHDSYLRSETRRDVGSEIWASGQKIASRQDDDIFYVTPSTPPPKPGDFQTQGLTIMNFSKEVAPGDAIFVDATGTVKDVNAGYPDNWQIACAVAVVDENDEPDSGLRTQYEAKSSVQLFSPTINLNTPFQPYVHLWFTPMPDHEVKVKTKLFANHDSSKPFDWNAWKGNNASGWQLLDTKELKIVNPGAEMKKWLLIGGGVVAVGLVIALVKK